MTTKRTNYLSRHAVSQETKPSSSKHHSGIGETRREVNRGCNATSTCMSSQLLKSESKQVVVTAPRVYIYKLAIISSLISHNGPSHPISHISPFHRITSCSLLLHVPRCPSTDPSTSRLAVACSEPRVSFLCVVIVFVVILVLIVGLGSSSGKLR